MFAVDVPFKIVITPSFIDITGPVPLVFSSVVKLEALSVDVFLRDPAVAFGAAVSHFTVTVATWVLFNAFASFENTETVASPAPPVLEEPEMYATPLSAPP